MVVMTRWPYSWVPVKRGSTVHSDFELLALSDLKIILQDKTNSFAVCFI